MSGDPNQPSKAPGGGQRAAPKPKPPDRPPPPRPAAAAAPAASGGWNRATPTTQPQPARNLAGAGTARQTIQENRADQQFTRRNRSNATASECPYAAKPAAQEPCYLYKLTITEQWSQAAPPPPPPPADGEAISRQVQLKQRELENEQAKLDQYYTRKRTATDGGIDPDDPAVRSIKENILRIQDEMVDLMQKRAAATVEELPHKSPDKTRVFTVLHRIPTEYEAKIEQGKSDLARLRRQLGEDYQQWHRCHKEHEQAKAELREFTKKKETLAKERDKKRISYEAAIRERKAHEEFAAASTAKDGTRGTFARFKHRTAKLVGRDARSKLADAKEAETKARAEHEAACSQHDDFAWGFRTKRTTEKNAGKALSRQTGKIREQTEEIEKTESGYQEMINTLRSGGESIQMVAAGHERWWTNWDSKGKGIEFDATDPSKTAGTEPTAMVTVELDKDAKPDTATPIGVYCKKPPDEAEAAIGNHPHLSVVTNKGGTRTPVETVKATKSASFRIWQAAQLDVGSAGPATMIQRFFGVLRVIFSAIPFRRRYLVEASSCGLDPEGRPQVGKALTKEIEVVPADSYTIAIKTAPAFGQSYNRSGAITAHPSDPTKPTVELVSTVGKDSKSFGVTQSSHSTSTSYSSAGIKETEVTESRASHSLSGSPDKVKMVDGVQDLSSSPPSFPSSFLPECPIDITFQRNGYEDEFSKHVKTVLGTIIWISREAAKYAGRISNWMPSVGYKIGFNLDLMAGTLAYTQQWREHTDRRVYLYKKGQVDIAVVSVKIFFFGGVWVEVLFVSFELGIELFVKGSIGIRGSVESTHPDSERNVDVGFGPTGSVAVGAEIRLVVGNADWCKAAGTLTTGIEAEGMFWMSHPDGPHFEGALKWNRPKVELVAHLILVGSWQFTQPIGKKGDKVLWHGTWPKPLEEQAMEKQNRSLEEERAQDARDAKKLRAEIEKKKRAEASK